MNALWQIRDGSRAIGSASTNQLKLLVQAGRLNPQHEVRAGSGQWISVSSLPWLNVLTPALSARESDQSRRDDSGTPTEFALGVGQSITVPRFRWMSAVLTSTAVHAVVIAVMSLIVIAVTREDDSLVIMATSTDLEDDGSDLEFILPIEVPASADADLREVPENYSEPSGLAEDSNIDLSTDFGPQVENQAGGDGSGAALSTIDGLVGDAGGSTSKVFRFSLAWRTRDDLDLGVITPQGNFISFLQKTASGGTLDVDANIYGETTTPVENIVWEKLPTEEGVYRVRVQLFARKSSKSEPVPFVLVTYVDGKVKTYQQVLKRTGDILEVALVPWRRTGRGRRSSRKP